MSRLGKITRRSFLVASTAVAGGVAFGFYAYRKPPENPLLADRKDGEAIFNPWVRIDAEGITLITPHTDLGQGATSMQAALIAEELDVEFGQFKTSPGVPSAAYYNTVLGGDALSPYASYDESMQAVAARGVFNGISKLMGLQTTGGSSAVPDSFDKLRRAGAVARETLKAAAGRKTGVAVGELKTGKGAVVLPDGKRLSYVELAPLAATIEPVKEVALRDPKEWRLIGKKMLRLDIVAKSTGTLTYGIDLEMDGMVHAAIKVNPRRAAMKSYDASKAKAMRGVSKIVEITNGVAVIADNTWRAFKAAEAIACEWEPSSYPAEMDGHWSEVAASFTAERLDKEWRNDGDVETALKTGTAVSAEYKAPYVAHQPMEPLNAVVKVGEGRVDVWTAHQIPLYAQRHAAKAAGVSPDQVHLHNQYAGGSFGHRLEFDFVIQAAEIARQMPGVPVKLTYRREDDFALEFPRQIGMARGKGSVADGKVASFDLEIATPSVLESQGGRLGEPLPPLPDGEIAAGAWNLPYAVPNFRLRAYRVPKLAPISSWRSVGASTAGFFADGFLDELIHAAGADPLEERLRLAKWDVARKVLEAVGEMSDWKGAKPGDKRGRGVALVVSFGVPCAEVVEVTDTEDGIRIDKVFVAADVGRIVDPVNFDNHLRGGVIWGLGHAMNCEITYSDGQVSQANFGDHTGMRMEQCPQISVRGLENASRIRGIGEPTVPPAAPALANAIFAATGRRLREMPFNKHVEFA